MKRLEIERQSLDGIRELDNEFTELLTLQSKARTIKGLSIVLNFIIS